MPFWPGYLPPQFPSVKAGRSCGRTEALGGLGLELMKDENWRDEPAGLENIGWSKKNDDWENICIVANSVVSNRQAQAATKAYIKGKLDMDLTDSEKRSLDTVKPENITQDDRLSWKKMVGDAGFEPATPAM